MKRSLALAGSLGLGCLLLAVGAQARQARPLVAHQEPRGVGHLVVPGDRVETVFVVDTRGVTSPKGSLYVRNDLQRRFRRVPLRSAGRTGLRAVVPGRLIRGHRLLYYAVIRDPRSGRSTVVPAAGARAPQSAHVLDRPMVVRLGTHDFGRTRMPEAVVARARPDQVGWQLPSPGQGPSFGPQTFLVGTDGSIFLDDSLNDRLLVYEPGRPDVITRSIPLPARSADNDVALGPADTVYVTGGVGRGLTFRHVLYRLSATGQVLWRKRLAAAMGDSPSFVLGANSPLRLGPDGTLYCLAGMPGLVGGEAGWMPVATPAGAPLSTAEQRRRTDWPYQPVTNRLRLVSEIYTPVPDMAPHEARYALIDRSGRVRRAWRVLSRTDINFTYTTPEVIDGDPVVVLDATAEIGGEFKWDRLVLRLGPSGVRTSASLPRAVFGDNILADLRIGADEKLYELASSPTSGVVISRYSLDPDRAMVDLAARHATFTPMSDVRRMLDGEAR